MVLSIKHTDHKSQLTFSSNKHAVDDQDNNVATPYCDSYEKVQKVAFILQNLQKVAPIP